MASVAWIGVCTADSAEILASVIIPPEAVPSVPCSTTLVGELSGGPRGVGGRLYLLNRVTFVMLGFSYDGTAPGTQCCHYLTASIPIDIRVYSRIDTIAVISVAYQQWGSHDRAVEFYARGTQHMF